MTEDPPKAARAPAPEEDLDNPAGWVAPPRKLWLACQDHETSEVIEKFRGHPQGKRLTDWNTAGWWARRSPPSADFDERAVRGLLMANHMGRYSLISIPSIYQHAVWKLYGPRPWFTKDKCQEMGEKYGQPGPVVTQRSTS